jgi:hypothetical protein
MALLDLADEFDLRSALVSYMLIVLRFPAASRISGRVLCVAVNMAVEPDRVVRVFFDRKMKGKL